jgi:hypothetical protein
MRVCDYVSQVSLLTGLQKYSLNLLANLIAVGSVLHKNNFIFANDS